MDMIWKRLISRVVAIAALICGTSPAWAGDDPSIQRELRTGVHAAMNEFVEAQTVDGVVRVYDPVEDRLLKLKFDGLHEGIVRKGDFYVSRADFVDHDGRKIDVDFLVIEKGDSLLATQAIVHSVDGKKRKYQLDSK